MDPINNCALGLYFPQLFGPSIWLEKGSIFNRPGPKAGSIHGIEVCVCVCVCMSVCSLPIYFF